MLKYQKDMLAVPIKERLEVIMMEIARNKGLEIKSLEIMPDHIHLFINAPPQYSPSLLVNWFKGISSRLYNHRFKDGRIRWTPLYYVGTAGTTSNENIQNYIEEQKCRDFGMDQEE